MDTGVQADLVRRLDALERANRRLRLSLVAVLLFVGSVALVGAAQPPAPRPGPVTATAFHLVGEDGSRRAELSAHGKSAQLVLNGTNGKRSVVLTGDEQGAGPKVAVLGPDGKTWLLFTAHWLLNDGTVNAVEPALYVNDRTGKLIGTLQKH
jgi:hypothetical protein